MAKKASGAITLGKNIDGQMDGDILTLRIDLSKTNGDSSTGKNVIVATTGGNIEIGDTGIKLGLNAYKAKTKK